MIASVPTRSPCDAPSLLVKAEKIAIHVTVEQHRRVPNLTDSLGTARSGRKPILPYPSIVADLARRALYRIRCDQQAPGEGEVVAVFLRISYTMDTGLSAGIRLV